jgi:hypothetical protein
MKISSVLAAAILALGLAGSPTVANDATIQQNNFRQLTAAMNNVEWTIHKIGHLDDVSDVKLVQLDGSLGENQQAFEGALAAQQGTAQIDALREAIAGNRRLLSELARQHIDYMNIVAVRIGELHGITVYTFGASA